MGAVMTGAALSPPALDKLVVRGVTKVFSGRRKATVTAIDEVDIHVQAGDPLMVPVETPEQAFRYPIAWPAVLGRNLPTWSDRLPGRKPATIGRANITPNRAEPYRSQRRPF